MAENQEMVQQQEKQPDQENPIISFFTNLLAAIKLPFPIPQKKNDNSKKNIDSPITKTNPTPTTVVEDEVSVVTFPKSNDNFDQLKLQTQTEDAEQTTNPLLLWQVYAIGGFFILKWGWSRWNERKGQKKSGDEPPPTDD